jgi:signal peptidase II
MTEVEKGPKMPRTRMPIAPFALSLAIIALDQVSKALVSANVAPGTIGFSAFGDFLWIVKQQNLGIAFSLLDKLSDPWRPLLLITLPLILVAAVLVFYFKSQEPTAFQRWVLCGIVGGGIGNVIDRIFRPQGVIDFISVKFYGLFGFERWPTFNVADSSVVVCAILLVISTIIIDSRRRT